MNSSLKPVCEQSALSGEQSVDGFFRQSIVGGPLCFPLGTAVPAQHLARVGIDVSPRTLGCRIPDGWLSYERPSQAQYGQQHGVRRLHTGLKAYLVRFAPLMLVCSLFVNIVMAGLLLYFQVLR